MYIYISIFGEAREELLAKFADHFVSSVVLPNCKMCVSRFCGWIDRVPPQENRLDSDRMPKVFTFVWSDPCLIHIDCIDIVVVFGDREFRIGWDKPWGPRSALSSGYRQTELDQPIRPSGKSRGFPPSTCQYTCLAATWLEAGDWMGGCCATCT